MPRKFRKNSTGEEWVVKAVVTTFVLEHESSKMQFQVPERSLHEEFTEVSEVVTDDQC